MKWHELYGSLYLSLLSLLFWQNSLSHTRAYAHLASDVPLTSDQCLHQVIQTVQPPIKKCLILFVSHPIRPERTAVTRDIHKFVTDPINFRIKTTWWGCSIDLVSKQRFDCKSTFLQSIALEETTTIALVNHRHNSQLEGLVHDLVMPYMEGRSSNVFSTFTPTLTLTVTPHQTTSTVSVALTTRYIK